MWQVDTGIFDEKILLPITGITYKGVKFEGQHTKINVGPLTCHPPTNQYDFRKHLESIEQKAIQNFTAFETKLNTLEQNEDIDKLRINDLQENDVKQDGEIANHESRIDTLEKIDLEQEETLTVIPKCPSGKMFKTIRGKCYAFENVKRSFQATQSRCGQIFGNQAGGKIFEPRSDQVMKEVLEYAKIAWDNANPQLWMGITDESSEGNFVYPSDGQSHKLSSWRVFSGYPNSRSDNCLLIYPSYLVTDNRLQMLPWSCSANLAAICEWVI